MPPPNTPEEYLPNATEEGLPSIVNLHTVEYVDPVDQELICPICRDPFVAPYITICDHTFCFTCIFTAWEISKTCPIDRTPLTWPDHVEKAPKIVQNQLGNLKIRCPHSTHGCKQILRRCDVEDHVVLACPYAPVDCPGDGCNEKVSRGDADKKVCLHFTLPCDYCGRSVEYLSMETHLNHDCPKSHQPCLYCTRSFPRFALVKHQAECDEAVVPCNHAKLGCYISMKRKERDAHVQSCPYTILEKLGALVSKQQEQIGELEKRDRERERRIKSLEFHLQSPFSDCARTQQNTVIPRLLLSPSSSSRDNPHLDRSEDVIADNEEAFRASSSGSGGGTVPPPFESMDQYLLSLYESCEGKMDMLQKSVSDLEGRQTVMLLNETMPIKEQMTEMRSQIGVQAMHVRWLMNLRFQERSRNINAEAGTGGAFGGNSSGVPPASPDGQYDEFRGIGRRLSDALSLRENPPRL